MINALELFHKTLVYLLSPGTTGIAFYEKSYNCLNPEDDIKGKSD